ncbi:hypothetical protein HNR77_005461 [Paenibacillus sp. JGP012]|uniref:hypothetical protein n=1 Tax=Paenibacillus sp. JGP012 TaxID=2735914 RepID=UPI00160F1B8E|nr:hypothetical protein [Paenibacillus sp. JGP012]MBB6024353.1 hypothetical protein [Paenibacillus sp. JGP012]
MANPSTKNTRNIKNNKMLKTWKRIGAMALSLTLMWGLGPAHTLSDASAASMRRQTGAIHGHQKFHFNENRINKFDYELIRL